MASAVCVRPTASGRGLCGRECGREACVDRESLNYVSKNWEVLARGKYTDNFGFSL